MFKRIYILYISLVLFHGQIIAQPEKVYSFKHIDISNGLASYNSNGCVQDSLGYLWVATINGLQRYDGYRFTTYRHIDGDSNSLSNNFVTQLMIDSRQNLWVTLADGNIGIFDTKRFKFHKAKLLPRNAAAHKMNRRIMEDSHGNVICIFAGLEAITFHRERNEFSPLYNVFRLPDKWNVVSIAEDKKDNKYWIATDSGMVIYNSVSKKLSYRGHNTEQEPFVELLGGITHISVYGIDRKRRVWFFSWPPAGASRIYCYNLQQNREVLHAYALDARISTGYIEPRNMIEQKDGTIWIYGLNVFARFSEPEKTFYPVHNGYVNMQSIAYENINLYEDREQNIWVSTNNNGLYVFNPARQFFNSIRHVNRKTGKKAVGGMMSFLECNDGSILAGAWNDGLFRYDSQFNNIPLAISGIDTMKELSVWDMCKSNDGHTTWITGQPSFVWLYDQQSGIVKKYNPTVFENRTIRQVAEDKQGNAWFGMHGSGVVKWSKQKASDRFEDGFYKISGIPKTLIIHIDVDSKGYVWICTATHGVYKINPVNDSIIEHITDKGTGQKRLMTNSVAVAFEYDDSTMIFISGGLNIYHLNSNTIEFMGASHGLPSEMAVAMQKDRKGHLWVSFVDGISRINLQMKTCINYNRNDGISNDNFDVSATAQLKDGRILFGSSDDFVVFDPADLKRSEIPVKAMITDFRIRNKSISVDSLFGLSRIELSADQNNIVINFSTLTFRTKFPISYKLEGLDTEWIRAGESRQAVYNYLPAGTYTFQLKTENDEGESADKITSIIIVVKPPFWKTWWFICLVFLLAGSLIYWIDKLQVKRKEAILQMRSDIAGNLHEEVNKALGNINILSEMAKIKADTEPGKSKEYIEQIHSRSQNMMIAMDDMLWSLDPENDNMQRNIERMQEYMDALQQRYAVRLSLTVDEEIPALELNMKTRHESFLMIKELMVAMVQAGATECKILVSLEKSNLQFVMQFENAGSELGSPTKLLERTDMKKSLASINGILDAQVHKTHSIFILLVPVE